MRVVVNGASHQDHTRPGAHKIFPIIPGTPRARSSVVLTLSTSRRYVFNVLTLFDGDRPMGRRELLRAGTLGLGGLTLPDLLTAGTSESAANKALTGKSVIFLFQQGGPSQFETFDPKRHTIGGEIPTSIPGIHFGSTMTQLAALADKLAVVRSFYTGNGGHNIQPIMGKDTLNANLGVHYARVAGAARPDTGIPTNTILYPAAVDPTLPKPEARGNLASTGDYGSGYVPFVPGGGGQLQADMRVALPHDRVFDDRRSLLRELDRLRRAGENSEAIHAMDRMQQRAYQLLLGGGVPKALDLANEDPRIVARYDTADYARQGARWNKVNRGKKGYYTANATSIGKLLLMARRLCEAGCGFVTIHAGYAGVWDMHADGNNLNMHDGMEAVGRAYDHAVAAFIRDLEERGLQDRIMLVSTGEMGRTPKINKRGGRDHWPRLAPLLVYGGGIPGGQVIGSSDRQGGEPSGPGYGPRHLISTVLRTLIDPTALRLRPEIPQAIPQLLDHAPIPLVS